MRGDWQRSQVLEYLFEPARSNQERQERRQEKAEVEAALNLVPPEWKEMASASYTRPRLIMRRLEEAKGDEEYRFDNMGDMFIVEVPTVYGPQLGLAYITFYVGFGALHFVLLANNDGNTEMYATKGMLNPNVSGREWRFFKISDRNLHANVPRAAANAPAPQAAAAAVAYPAAVGANPLANIAGANVEEEDPKNPNNNNSNARRGGRRKRMKKAKSKSKKTSRKHKKHTRKHTRKH